MTMFKNVTDLFKDVTLLDER